MKEASPEFDTVGGRPLNRPLKPLRSKNGKEV